MCIGWKIYTFACFCSGYSAENIDKVLRGLRVGTLFHQDARLWAPVTDSNARDMAVAARESSRKLQVLSRAFFNILIMSEM